MPRIARTITNITKFNSKLKKVLESASNLVKQGVGSLTLSGTNTYSGTASVSAGYMTLTKIASGPNKIERATFTPSLLTVNFSSAPADGETYRLLLGPTVQTYSAVTLTGAVVPGTTAKYNSATSTLTLSVPTPPDAPTNVVATAGNAQVGLSWTAPSYAGSDPITDYIIQYSSNSGSTWTTFNDGVSTATSTTVIGLTNGTSYIFRVAAKNSAGSGSYSSNSNVATPVTVPSSPTGLVATFGNTQVSLSWTAPNNGGSAITDYIVQYSSNSGSTWATFDDGTSTATTAIVTGLTNGTSYIFKVAAVNSVGNGSYSSNSNSATPAAVPSAPTGLTATAGNAQAVLSWTAPSNNGGSAITDYIVQYSSNSGSTWTTFNDGVSNATSATATGLTNGTSYIFRVAAVNAAGTGTYSSNSSAVTPVTVPSAPTGLITTAGNTQVSLSWTAPSNGGSAITDYLVQYSSNSGSTWSTFNDGVSTSTTATVNGLTNGTAYLFRVAAVNSVGTGSYSLNSNAVTPATTPSAPSGLNAIAGNLQVSLSWNTPSNNGSAITDYVIQYSSDSGSTWSTFNDGVSTATTSTVTGLTNGTSYIFKVAATNSIGTGSYSSNSSAVTPATLPSAPTGLTATSGNAQVSLSWTAPNNGGSAITDYTIQYSSNSGLTWTIFNDGVSTATTGTVTGLTNGTSYIFKVAATNIVGAGSYSSNSGAVTPSTTPSAPTGLVATSGNAQVSLSWSAPSNGGSAITDYVIRYSSDSGSTWTIFNDGISTATTSTVTGLTNGTSYIFQVAAVNSQGTGVYSSSSSAVTPATKPSAPTNLVATSGNAQVSLSWTAPSNGGSAITDYAIQYSSNAGSTWTTFNDGVSTATSATVTGLTNGTSYVFRVAATNALGTGSYSSNSSATIPATTPSFPTSLVATFGNTQVSISWATPSSNGGSSITDYAIQYSSDAGSTWTTFNDGVSTATTSTVTGLANGTSYLFKVAAINIAGTGTYSSTVSATPATVPSSPTSLVATSGNAQVSLSWSAPSDNGGSSITDYTAQYSSDNGATWTTFNNAITTETSSIVTGLTNGASYLFKVAAINNAGTGIYSTSVSATPILTTAPAAPTGLSSTVGNSQISLSWTAPSNDGGTAITDYLIQYSPDNSTWTTFDDGVSTATTASVTVPTSSTAYYFRVAAVNGQGAGSYSASYGPVQTRPGKPANLGVTLPADGTVSLSWTAPSYTGLSDISDYIIQYSSDNSTWTTFDDGVSTATTSNVSVPTNFLSCYFRVSSVNAQGSGSYSDVYGPIQTRPDKPTGLNSTIPGNGKISLSWTAPSYTGLSAISDYVIQYSSDNNTWTTFNDGVSTATSADVTVPTSSSPWYLRVATSNGQGSGSYSDVYGPVQTRPDKPTGLIAVYGNGQASLSWTAPTYPGLSPVSDYAVQYSSNSGSTWTSFAHTASSDTSITVTGLTNGTPYIFRVAATNGEGAGDYSSNSNAATPATTPSPPTSLVAVAGDTQASLSWNAPSNNGSAVISYIVQYSSDSGSTWTTFDYGASTSTSAVVTGLVNSTSYLFKVAATNAVGTGFYSSNSNSVTPATSPDAPANFVATAGNAQVGLSWAAPTNNGGSAITDYVVQYSSNAGSTWTTFNDGVSTSTTTTVTGLTNGTSYLFRVASVNAIGTGAYSSNSNVVTPITTPVTPTNLVATAGNTQASLSWTAPSDNGGATVTDYSIQYSSDSGSTWVAFAGTVGTSTIATVTGLTNGTSYIFKVAAINSVGAGSYSSNSSSVTPAALSDAPSGLVATSGNAQASLSWTAPASNGSSITDYTVQYSSNSGSSWTTFSRSASAATTAAVTGLTNGRSYIFRVAAVNGIGTGAFSSNSSSVTPATTPSAPTGLVATAGDTQASLSWTVPASTGGSNITDYTVQFSSNAGSTWTTFADGVSTATTATVTGLTNGTSYVFRVAAVNGVGTGTYSSSSAATIPVTTPSAPTGLTATSGSTQASLSWTAPGSGGTAITDYVVQYSSNAGGTWTTFNDGVSTATTATVTGLINGTSYVFRVAGVNAVGTGIYSSNSGAVTPATTPSAPTGLVAASGNGQASLYWTAPDNGGSALIDYVIQYSSDSGSTWTSFNNGVSTDTSTTVTGLTNGTAYLFQVAAVNIVGTGQYSASSSATPATTPSAPTGLVVVAGNAQASLSWVNPTSNGGANITDYVVKYSSNSGSTWITFNDGISTATNATVTGLANGTSYLFSVAAANSAGTGDYSPNSDPITPFTIPAAPTGVSATSGNAQVSLSWTAPNNGGSAITDYIIQYSSDAGSTWTTFNDGMSASTTTIVTGLTNGTSYLFKVAAVNSSGTGPYSSNSNPSVPATVPSAPTGLVATSGNTQISLSWTAPNNNGSAVSDYSIQYSSDSGSTWADFSDGVSLATTATVTGLANGTSYLFRVSATNSVGTGSYSSNASGTPATTASAPTIIAATSGNAQVSLSWTAPTNNGGANITDYIVQYSSNSGSSWTPFSRIASTATTVTVTGLTNGTSYIFKVATVNSAGTGAYSSNSASVVPATVPSFPTGLAATSGDSQASLSWTAPNNGGSAITDYLIQYSSNSGSTWTTFNDGVSTATTAVVTGLTNGTSYVFKVAAVNGVGVGPYSSISGVVVPAVMPANPTNLVATAGNAQVSLSWTAPTNNGGSSITDYVVQYSSNAGSTWQTFADGVSTATVATVTGLVNGTSYVFRVASVNSVGTGTYSSNSNATTPATTPSAPTSLTTTAGNTQVSLSWTAPNNGGAPITDYVLQYSSNSGSTWTAFNDGVSTATNATVVGLTNGTSYIFKVAATNNVGTGPSSTSNPTVPVTVPSAPTGLVATPGNTQISLSWTSPSDNGGSVITDYAVQYSSDSGSTWATFNDGISTATSATVTGLTNGTSYMFKVAAVNAVGAGSYSSNSTPVIFATTPSAPANLTSTLGNAQVSLSWIAPNNGGSAITDYVIQYSSNSGSTWTTFADGVSTATTSTVTGLANGTSYVFRVAALNDRGTGAYSLNSGSVTFATTPFAPTSLVATAGNAQTSLSWTAPTNNGGSAITDYVIQYSSDAGSTWATFNDGVSTLTAATVTGLVNGTSYVFKVAAVNSIGTGSYSSNSSAVTPATVPSAPTALTATAGNAQASLSWTAPTNNGGSAITDYIVQYSSNAGSTWTTFADGISTLTSATVTGLVNGTSYVFRVATVNNVGTGTYSSSSNAATPATVASVPTGLVATAGNAQASLSWTAPTNNGGFAITDYMVQYSSDAGSTWTTFNDGVSTATTATVTGLANGTPYLFRVATVNGVGTGAYSSNSSSITPFTVPSAPTSVNAISGNVQASLSWTAPTNNGGSAITDYLVQYSSDAGTTWTTFADGVSTATAATVTGLTNGTSYVFRVAATNAAGSGAYSLNSASIVPATVPSAPTTVTATAGNAQASLSWTAPGNGGSAITDYIVQYSSNAGSTWTTFNDGVSTATTATVTGLVNGTSYVFRVAAVNGVGTSSYSPNSNAVTPVTAPSAPTGIMATAGNAQASLSWTAPNNGGSAITDYLVQYSSNAGSTWTTFADGVSAATTATVTGLVNGTSYLLRVAAVNGVGTGAYSSNSSAVTPATVPSAPTALTATAGNAQAYLSWTAPSNGGSAITDYIVQYSSNAGSTWATFNDGVSALTSATVTGLSNGTSYVFRVAAVNSVGIGSYSSNSNQATLASTFNLLATGDNHYGQLGLGNTTQRNTFTQVGTSNWKSVSCGSNHTLAVRSDGTLWATGYNSNGQLGLGDTTDRLAFTQVGTNTNWKSVSCGASHTLAVRSDGTLWATGNNGAGQLGLGDNTQRNAFTQVGTNTNWKSVSCGAYHALAVRTDGTLWATGYNGYGQLGFSDNTNRNTFTQVGTANNWNSVSCGWYHTLALRSDGTLWATGYNGGGQLGFSDNTDRNAFTQVGTSTNWKSVSCGGVHTLAVRSDGTLWATGYNGDGQLGFSDNTGRNAFTQVGTSTNWNSVSCGDGHTMAIRSDGTLWATGNNTNGQLGFSDNTNRNAFTQVGTNTNWKSVSCGTFHTMAMIKIAPSQPTALAATAGNAQASLSWTAPTNDGGSAITDYAVQYSSDAGFTWATFNDGVSTATTALVTGLVNGTLYLFKVAAVNSSGIGTYSSTASATPLPGNTLWGTGSNGQGQLGIISSTYTVTTLVQVSMNSWLKVACGAYETFAVRSDKTLWRSAAAANISPNYGGYFAQIGTDNDWANVICHSQIVPGPIIPTTAYYGHVYAIKTNGTLWGMGGNGSGELGLGDTTYRDALTLIGAATNWASVSAGFAHAFGIRTDGTLWATGGNGNGQLGLGNNTGRNTFTQVGTVTNWKSVSCGSYHTLAVRSDGTLWATGNNFSGQLGLGDTTDRNTLTRVGTATNWASVSCGASSTLAVRTDGTLWATGNNSHSQLGLGDTIDRITFTQVGTGTNWARAVCPTGNYMGSDGIALAIQKDGTLWVTGTAAAAPGSVTSFTRMDTNSGWKDVAAGAEHTMAMI